MTKINFTAQKLIVIKLSIILCGQLNQRSKYSDNAQKNAHIKE